MTEPASESAPETASAAGLTRLDTGQIGVFRVQAAVGGIVTVIVLTAAAAILNQVLLWRLPLPTIAIGLLVLYGLWVIFVPRRRYRHWGYAMGADAIRIASGFVFRIETVVPFARVQHIDVARGPVERVFGVATLILHTAGSYNSTVHLPGLAPEDAVAMREEIRRHIREEPS